MQDTSTALAWLKEQAKVTIGPIARAATRYCARILMYHRFGALGDPRRLSVDALDAQLRYIQRHFTVVPLRDVTARLRAGLLPQPRSVVLTVDDAYGDFEEVAYPVFRRYQLPVTLYVVGEFASGRFWLWWDAVRYVLVRAPEGTYRVPAPDGHTIINLSNARSRERAWINMAAIGLSMPPDDREVYVAAALSAFPVAVPRDPAPEYAAMSWDRLRALDPDLIEIGAHTHTHPVLSRCSSERIAWEFRTSKRAIEEQIGREVRALCYPHGEWTDVDTRCMTAARDAGFDSAVMACGTFVGKGANLYALDRIPAPEVRGEFLSHVSGISHLRRQLARQG